MCLHTVLLWKSSSIDLSSVYCFTCFAMEKVAPVPLFRPLCKRISYKNGKVRVNFKNISGFRMLTSTPARLFRGTPSLWIL